MVRGSSALWRFIHGSGTYGKSSFSPDIPKRDPERAKNDRRMEMSPVIRKQGKKGLKGSRREEEGGRTYDGAIERPRRGKVSRIGIRRRKIPSAPGYTSRSWHRGCVAASGRRDKKTGRKRKEGRDALRHEGSGYSSVTHVL